MDTFEKPPIALLDYQVDWGGRPWLASAETIATSEWFLPADLTLSASAKTDTTATAWIEGGTPGRTYRVTNRISTNQSRVEERSFLLRITER